MTCVATKKAPKQYFQPCTAAAHHWVLEEPGLWVAGGCINCGQARVFPGVVPDWGSDFRHSTKAPAPRPRRALSDEIKEAE